MNTQVIRARAVGAHAVLASLLAALIYLFALQINEGRVSPALRQDPSPAQSRPAASVQSRLAQLPLYFVENQGQVDPRAFYYVQGSDKTIFFRPEGVTFVLNGDPVPENSQVQPPRPVQAQPAHGSLESAPAQAEQRWVNWGMYR
ncbi:MAG: hypothetical protein M1358_13995, partial [Chloroflexi bacterium]|nr:hypothetical protein [Chloroflexota bacterium]